MIMVLPVSLGLSRYEVSELAKPFHAQVSSLRTCEDVAKHFGIQIEFGPQHNSVYLKARITDEVFWVGLDSNKSGWANRLDLLVAVGHSVLHKTAEGLLINNWVDPAALEEAMWFATGALMPRERFCEQAAALEGNIVLLSDHFGVSEKQIELRAKSLDCPLITQKNKRYRMVR